MGDVTLESVCCPAGMVYAAAEGCCSLTSRFFMLYFGGPRKLKTPHDNHGASGSTKAVPEQRNHLSGGTTCMCQQKQGS